LINARRLIFTTAGGLRALWRLFFFVLAFIASYFVAGAFIGPLINGGINLVGLRGQTTQSVVEMAAALLATWFCLVYIEKKTWKDVGLHAEAAEPRRIVVGFFVGSGAISVAIAFLIAGKWLDRLGGTADVWAGPTLRMTMLLLPAAFAEELISRGYILTAIRDAVGARWAVVLTSVLFGLAHLQNPGANAQSLTMVALAGIFLAVVRLGTDSLYAAWAAHFGWNWVMAALFHTPVSGFAFEYPAYRYVDAGPDWATGGGWGPESGIPAGVMMVVGIGVLLRLRKRSAGE
jgi:membrane protease YdiL (CAAX protease family)